MSLLTKLFSATIIALFLSSCENDNFNNSNNSNSTTGNGKGSKGPFIADSSVSAFSLNANGTRNTATAATATTTGNTGAFTFNNIGFSGATELEISGFYLNENTGSTTQTATLTAVINVVAGSNFTANINVFTDIQARRIKALMATDNNINLTTAQASATASVVALFGLTSTVDLGALDLTDGSSENNLILLRASAAIAMQPSILSDLQAATVNANLTNSTEGSQALQNLNTMIGTLNLAAIVKSIATVSDNTPTVTTAALERLNNAPIITQINERILEDTETSTNLSASDANNNTLTFSAISLNTSLVTVTTTTGATTNSNTVGTLNFVPQLNQNGTATIVVSAVDSEGARNSIQFVLVVAPVNDAPVANPFGVFISLFSDSAAGTVVRTAAQVQSRFTDVDGDTLTYSITSGNGSNTFAIDTTSGEITTAINLNEAQVDTYILGITASDGNNDGVATATLTVIVNNIPIITVPVEPVIAPIITSSSTVNVTENQTFVLNVTSTDADSTNNNTFSTTLAGADASLFSITSAGALTFNSAPNFEAANSAAGNNTYIVIVTATNGIRSSTQTVAVTITNVIENMIGINAQTRTIDENSATGSSVGAVLVTTGDPSTFTITGSSFTIDNTGQITNLVELDFETTPRYTATVTISKADALDESATITIEVSNVIENTIAIADQTRSIAETSTTSLNVGAILATTGSPSTFSITGSSFAIDNTGQITNLVELDFETTPSYTATVTISKADALDESATITINVNAPLPSAPATLTAVATGVRNQVRISWAAVPGATGYNLYATTDSLKNLNNSNHTDLSMVSTTKTTTVGTSMTFTLSGTQTVGYLVTATNNVGESLTNSTQTAATAFAAPFGTVTSPDTTRVWMDRNLGASQVATGSTDTMAYGDLYQWGRAADGHQRIDRTTTGNCFNADDSVSCRSSLLVSKDEKATNIAATTAGIKFLASSVSGDWLENNDDNNGARRAAIWGRTDGTSICPTGFNVPTREELVADTIHDDAYTGRNNITNTTTAFSSFLKLPFTSFRHYFSGAINGRSSTSIFLWTRSAIIDASKYAHVLRVGSTGNPFIAINLSRDYGFAVRCIRN